MQRKLTNEDYVNIMHEVEIECNKFMTYFKDLYNHDTLYTMWLYMENAIYRHRINQYFNTKPAIEEEPMLIYGTTTAAVEPTITDSVIKGVASVAKIHNKTKAKVKKEVRNLIDKWEKEDE